VTPPPVAFLPASIDACALFRMFLPHIHTPGSVFHFKEGGLVIDQFSHCKIVVVQRLCTQENYEAIKALKRHGMKIVYDLDDNLWAVPSYNPAHRVFRHMEGGFRFCAAECDAVTVSTAPLKVAAFNAFSRNKHTKRIPPIRVIPNSMDFDWIAPVPEQYRKKKDGKVVLGWAGTNTHAGEVDEVFNLLPKLLEMLPNLYLEFVGLPAPAAFKKDGEVVHPRVREREFVPIAEFPVRWSSWQWDISIAPLEMNRFNTSKSNIKMLEAAALSIPCLVSPAPPYKDLCKKSTLLTDTLLCNTLKEWTAKITNMVQSQELRAQVGKELRTVAEEYNATTIVQKWFDLFEELL
jgi:glycosyltransferase involved in cell wall biosynthesis